MRAGVHPHPHTHPHAPLSHTQTQEFAIKVVEKALVLREHKQK